MVEDIEKKEEDKDEKKDVTPADEEQKEDEDSEEEESDSEDVDFDKDLEDLESKKPKRTELEKAVFTAKQLAKKITELGGDATKVFGKEKKVETEEEDETEDAPVTKKQFAEYSRETERKEALKLAKALGSSEGEVKVIMWHLENSIVRSGSLEDDVENAHVLANRKKLKRVASEIARADEARGSGHAPTGGGQKPRLVDIPDAPKEVQDTLRRRGFTLNAKTKEWEAKFTKVVYNKETKKWDTIRKS